MSGLLVHKYGGTSVGSTSHISRVAQRIKDSWKEGSQVVVIVSAMGKTTDSLVDLAANIASNPLKREIDMLLSTGEQVSISLLAMALHEIEVPAISFTGWQARIHTDSNFSNARIKNIEISHIKKELDKGKVVIVAGFQGIDEAMNITTLGRGGSDTSAVAIAAILEASECEIFTDVSGVYTADPNKVLEASKLERISYDEMLELSSLGAAVLHSRAAEFAKKYSVKLHVRSSFNFEKGTLVVPEEEVMEKPLVTGITSNNSEIRISLADIPDQPGVAAKIFSVLADSKINVDMIVQSSGSKNKNTISFTIGEKDQGIAIKVLEPLIKSMGGAIEADNNIGIVSAVGIGMKSHTGIAFKFFKALADEQINIKMISTSEIKISVVIQRDQVIKAMNIVHDIFELGKND